MNGDGPAVTENNEKMMKNYGKNNENNEKMMKNYGKTMKTMKTMRK